MSTSVSTKPKSLIARRVPWWGVLLLGVACVVVGAVLTAEPFRSFAVLVGLVAAALSLHRTIRAPRASAPPS